MGAQLVTEERKMGCALLVEVGATTLQDHLKGRIALEGRSKRDHPLLTERREVADRARMRRVAMFNYIMNWLECPIFEGESTRVNQFHESTPDEVDRMEQQIHYVLKKITNPTPTHAQETRAKPNISTSR